MTAECGVMAMAFIDRLTTQTRVHLEKNTWKRILLACLALAYKVWEDDSVWNEDILSAFPQMTVADLGQLEFRLLEELQFRVTLKASDYAKYYFELRALATDDELFPLEPLTKENAAKLYHRTREVRNSRCHLTARGAGGPLRASHDAFVAPPKGLSLEQIAFRNHLTS